MKPSAPTVPITFGLYRIADPSGVSGCGLVADGTWYPNGKVALAWRGEHPSVSVFESLDDVRAIHGHGGMTRLVPYAERTHEDSVPHFDDANDPAPDDRTAAGDLAGRTDH